MLIETAALSAAIPIEKQGRTRVAPVVAALSYALDLSTGQPVGHSVRSCLIGMRIAEEIGLSPAMRGDLFYGLLLKDCGCSGNASKTFHAFGSDDLKVKRDVKITDWTRIGQESFQYALDHVAPGKPFLERAKRIFVMAMNQKVHARDITKVRCERGSTLARLMGLSDATARGILSLDEHWDGNGNPDGLRRTAIPIFSRIMLLAQTLDVHLRSGGLPSAMEVINSRSKTWFDPELVRVVIALTRNGKLWPGVQSAKFKEICLAAEPEPKTLDAGDGTLDNICMAFANIIDAKSPYTLNHSVGVANAAVAAARMLGLSRERVLFLRHASLLHDLGKLSVSNAILEKPAKLDAREWSVMKQHPFYTWSILRAIPGFEEMSEVAGSHHEKLDGKGYFRGIPAEYLPVEARILAVADVFDALTAKRPYRDGLPPERVFEIMGKDALDPVCLEALKQSGAACNQTYVDLASLSAQLDKKETSILALANVSH